MKHGFEWNHTTPSPFLNHMRAIKEKGAEWFHYKERNILQSKNYTFSFPGAGTQVWLQVTLEAEIGTEWKKKCSLRCFTPCLGRLLKVPAVRVPRQITLTGLWGKKDGQLSFFSFFRPGNSQTEFQKYWSWETNKKTLIWKPTMCFSLC